MNRYARMSHFGIVMAVMLGVVAVPARQALAAPPDPQPGPQSAPSIVPFSGTATTSFTSTDSLVPQKARTDLARTTQTETFAVRDLTHWRIDRHVLAPAINSQDETVVSNGQQVVDYSTLTNQALRLQSGITESGYLLSAFLQPGGSLVGTTAAQLIALEKRNPRVKVKSLGLAQVVGQTTDVLRISPLVSVSSGSCTGPKSCAKNEKGYGSATLWLDHDHGVVLRYQEHIGSKHSFGRQGYQYLVTSIAYGSGPSDTSLAYVPPVAIHDVTPNSGSSGSGFSSSGSSSTGSGQRFVAPPGFINIETPVARGMSLSLHGTGSGGGGLGSASTYAIGVFGGDPKPGFAYVEQIVRALGLPAALTSGSAHAAGSCHAWTGTFPDKVNWLAMMRGQIAILVASDTLSQADLVKYAATGICRATVTPQPSAHDLRNTALDRSETEIDITRQILGSVIAAAPTVTDKSTLKTYDARLQTLDRLVFALRYGKNTAYRPPGFPPPDKGKFKDVVVALTGEVSAAKYQLAGAEAAVTSAATRQKLEHQGAVFDDLIHAVDGMVSTSP